MKFIYDLCKLFYLFWFIELGFIADYCVKPSNLEGLPS